MRPATLLPNEGIMAKKASKGSKKKATKTTASKKKAAKKTGGKKKGGTGIFC